MTLPRIIVEGKTPEQWVEVLRERGVEISLRALKDRAREKGACRKLGNAMILMPEHIDAIFEEPVCRSNFSSAKGATSGGSVDDLLMATDMSEKALARLTRQSQKRPSARSRRKPAEVVSLDRTRRSPKI